MKRNVSIGLWTMALVIWLHGESTRTVFIPRSWYDVNELVEETHRQTGITLIIQAEDDLGKMVLYDNLTDLEAVKEAVLEYFQYVLGKRVKWFPEENGWLLREGTAVELGLAMDLMTIEKLWLEATARGAFEFLDLPPDPPPKKPDPTEIVEKTDKGPLVDTSKATQSDESKGVIPPSTVGAKTPKPGPYWLVALWRKILAQLEKGGELERDRIRRAMRDEGLMGSVPLMELWLGKPIREFLMEPGAFVKSRQTEGMVRGAQDLAILSPSTQVTAQRLPAGTEIDELQTLPVIEGRRLEKLDRDPVDRDDLVSTIPVRRFPQVPQVAFRWPKRIVTLTSKSWWESFWKNSRSSHPEEKKVRPPSRRALQRRDEAQQAFDRWTDWNQERRARDTNRRDSDP